MRTTSRLLALVLAVIAAAIVADRRGLVELSGEPEFNPCLEPLRWRVNTVDPRFELSRDEFRRTVEAATAVWEESTARQLFQHDPVEGLPVELVYDQRQAATEAESDRRRRLEALESEIEERERVHALHQREYRRTVADHEEQVSAVRERIRDHNTTVEDWNARGGAPARVARQLEQRAAEIDRLRSEIDRAADSLERRGRELEAEAERLRQTIDEYNALLREHRRIPPRRVESGSFQETVVTRGDRTSRTDQRLTIYRFGDREELVRVLAHELGHALGLGHVDAPAAIMHEEYDAEDIVRPPRPHDADVVALIERCGTDTWRATR